MVSSSVTQSKVLSECVGPGILSKLTVAGRKEGSCAILTRPRCLAVDEEFLQKIRAAQGSSGQDGFCVSIVHGYDQ